MVDDLDKSNNKINNLLYEKKSHLKQQQQQIKSLNEQKMSLVKQISDQEISPLEAQTIAHQRLILESSIHSHQKQKEDKQQQVWDQELKNSKLISDMETEASKYNDLVCQLALTGSLTKFENGFNSDITVYPNKEIAREMVNVDLTGVIKPSLTEFKAKTGNEVRELQAKHRESQQALKNMSDDTEERKKKNKTLEQRLAKLDATLKKQREKFSIEEQENLSNVEDCEIEISQLKLKQNPELRNSERDLENINKEIAQIKANQQQEKKLLNIDICEAMDLVHHHRLRIRQMLEIFEQKCADSLEWINCTKNINLP